MKLEELQAKYVTEKRATDFITWYEKYLPEKCNKFLEIGIRFGASAKMFNEYYDGKVEMHLLDPFTLDNMSVEEAHELGFKTYPGSQSDLDLLETLPDDLDVISEDGSHHSDEQIITFKYLFKHKLKSGGLYCLEDLHCCREDWWHRGVVRGYKHTFLGVIEKVIAGGDFVSQYWDEEESDWYKQNIARIELHSTGGEIAFIWKK